MKNPLFRCAGFLKGAAVFAIALCCLPVTPVFAWSDHASLLWPLVRGNGALNQPTLRAEPLSQFLEAEADAIARVLTQHEQMARDNFPHYALRPDALAFSPESEDRLSAFLHAIRVNPTLPYGLYRQVMVDDEAVADEQRLSFEQLSFLSGGVTTDNTRYVRLISGEPVTPAQVLATASDEPDFGMDIGLFSDNGTRFGADYGFGRQPFGNPNLEYSSQAPFHMGFYHLDWLTRTAQPDLLRTFPEWRISLFQALASEAFATGHDYWGWRFMGWALHYIGDLTQPYHAQPLPGVSTPEALWKLLKGETAQAIQLVSNRHGVLESYQYQRVQSALSNGDWAQVIIKTISQPQRVPVFDDATVRGPLTAESVAAGEGLDAALEAYMPAGFVSDPAFEWTGSGKEAQIVERVREAGGEHAVRTLDVAVSQQMFRFSRYAQAWINVALAQTERLPGSDDEVSGGQRE